MQPDSLVISNSNIFFMHIYATLKLKKRGTTTNTMFRLILCKKMIPGDAFAKGAKERSSKNNITV